MVDEWNTTDVSKLLASSDSFFIYAMLIYHGLFEYA